MDAFQKTFEIASLINNSPNFSTEYKKPSEGDFTWNVATFHEAKKLLEEIKVLINYNPDGNEYYEPYEVLQTWIGTAVTKAEQLELKALTDEFYGDLFYYSDRWCLGRMARANEMLNQIGVKLGLPHPNG